LYAETRITPKSKLYAEKRFFVALAALLCLARSVRPTLKFAVGETLRCYTMVIEEAINYQSDKKVGKKQKLELHCRASVK
jgi:dsDNA-specific endonuclease/ATPase MutS2